MPSNSEVNPMKKKTAGAVRLSRKKYTFQLPLDVAAHLEALCEMHADTRRAQVLADVLALGLAQVTQAHTEAHAQPHAAARASQAAEWSAPDTKQAIYLLTGPFAEFHKLVRVHHLALEHEQSGDEPIPPAVNHYRLVDLE
jgi:hypothetical protein